MPKIYSDDTMKMVWDMVKTEKLKRKEIAEALDTTPEIVDSIYEAASRRFSHGPRARNIQKHEPVAEVKMVRVKGEYSNRSPMGIASEYLFDQ